MLPLQHRKDLEGKLSPTIPPPLPSIFGIQTRPKEFQFHWIS
ncbi:hypothetical protein KSS87_020135 [Heliosperma pusillum]|nr:hypothetical protein KSS87_020135 [Heliosperma pusillum]